MPNAAGCTAGAARVSYSTTRTCATFARRTRGGPTRLHVLQVWGTGEGDQAVRGRASDVEVYVLWGEDDLDSERAYDPRDRRDDPDEIAYIPISARVVCVVAASISIRYAGLLATLSEINSDGADQMM